MAPSWDRAVWVALAASPPCPATVWTTQQLGVQELRAAGGPAAGGTQNTQLSTDTAPSWAAQVSYNHRMLASASRADWAPTTLGRILLPPPLCFISSHGSC